MRRSLLIFLLNGSFLLGMAQSSITIAISDLPEYHPTGCDLYLAGSFNGWNAKDDTYKFKKDSSGNYSIILHLKKGNYEYKVTRGSWQEVETNKKGTAIDNRRLNVIGDTTLGIAIAEWQDRFAQEAPKRTISKNVQVVDTDFLIPQLKRTRRIWIYLPEGYAANEQKRYPVIYMQDGQNLFDEATAYAGEWGLDEFMDSTQVNPCIIVGIDNGGDKRLNEYNPFNHKRFGKGDGDAYVDFLAKTLKPYIDKHYRTIGDKENTGIGGSSMGGLISFYAVLKYPAVFGNAAIFSPSFQVAGEQIYTTIRKRSKRVKAKLYFYGGKLEGNAMVPDIQKAYQLLAKKSAASMTVIIKDEGTHSEKFWKDEFPHFYRWLNF